MLALRHGEQLRARLIIVCRRHLATLQQPSLTSPFSETAHSEYTDTPEYPPIRDLNFKSRKRQEATDWHEEIRKVPTIEEKIIKLNMPRYYGYKVVDLTDTKIPYNALPLTQHYTRTAFEELSAPTPVPAPAPVPPAEGGADDKFEAFVKTARADVIDAVELAHDDYRNKLTLLDTPPDAVTRELQLTQIILEQLNRVLLQTLIADYAHLHEIEVDYNPRHEAFWVVGGVDPPKNVVKSKQGREWQKEYANDTVDRMVQYTGAPYMALRHHQQLPTWKTAEESENAALAQQLPRFNNDARTLGYPTKYQHAVITPGYWPSAHAPNFGFLSFQSRARLQLRPNPNDLQDLQEALHALAIQSSYAWLLAQAYYNGFNTYNELTYPMNTQTVITNGREWSFYEYQLNTVLVHGKHVDENPRVNFCRGTAPLPLYGEITSAGRCVDFNDDTLRQLFRFYTNAPDVQRSADELQPYVGGPTLRRVADYDDPEKREFLEKTFKYLASKRPRHLELPEIYMWEKLYKIDNKTRAMEAKRRFFELDINPWRRTLDQHDKEYVSRQVRPGGKKNREGRFKKTYYP
ncbi:28S ribosomal protein S30, mitochondrial [Scaptodrosophila lebanonensis]|uniref:28S ribosomal protein S30, mitochondrial n=1 Tax=Drosophila lebanonensis TaxID=7225 RepID=A0A6J2TZK4_DROLE|nr:28S ribosomal protein S30, mitochondrial [Scaptodrosophila lebanonensis]